MSAHVETTDGERVEYLGGPATGGEAGQVRRLAERVKALERELDAVRQSLVDAELRHARDYGRLLSEVRP